MKNLDMETAIQELVWSDVCLEGIAWPEGGRDVALSLVFPDARLGCRKLSLVCGWANNVSVKLRFDAGIGGQAMTWSGSVQREAADGWVLELDFASAGTVSLRCSTIQLIPLKAV
ncbi:MAG: hypothetical protein AB8H86_25905 [Polyangiales bacterium]